MKKIIKDNYESIVKRGLISPLTTKKHFFAKLVEEVEELEFELKHPLEMTNELNDKQKEELSDIILVCLNFAEHFKVDIKKELEKKIIKNQNR